MEGDISKSIQSNGIDNLKKAGEEKGEDEEKDRKQDENMKKEEKVGKEKVDVKVKELKCDMACEKRCREKLVLEIIPRGPTYTGIKHPDVNLRVCVLNRNFLLQNRRRNRDRPYHHANERPSNPEKTKKKKQSFGRRLLGLFCCIFSTEEEDEEEEEEDC